jgi:hypothetical protein
VNLSRLVNDLVRRMVESEAVVTRAEAAVRNWPVDPAAPCCPYHASGGVLAAHSFDQVGERGRLV